MSRNFEELVDGYFVLEAPDVLDEVVDCGDGSIPNKMVIFLGERRCSNPSMFPPFIAFRTDDVFSKPRKTTIHLGGFGEGRMIMRYFLDNIRIAYHEGGSSWVKCLGGDDVPSCFVITATSFGEALASTFPSDVQITYGTKRMEWVKVGKPSRPVIEPCRDPLVLYVLVSGVDRQ